MFVFRGENTYMGCTQRGTVWRRRSKSCSRLQEQTSWSWLLQEEYLLDEQAGSPCSFNRTF